MKRDPSFSARRPRDRAFRILAVVAGVAVAVFSAARPLSAEDPATPKAAQGEELARWLDGQFERIWQDQGVEVEPCDDAVFVRRVYLDLLGRIPSVSEARDFLADPAPDKQARLVDRLLSGSDGSARYRELHAAHLARIWRRMMIPPGSNGAPMGPRFEPWLQEQFGANVAYDTLVRRLITADGGDAQRAGIFYQAVGGTPDAQATAVTRIFLGIRLGCAQCHDHPFADWKQKDFWGMAAFFSGANPRPGQTSNAARPGTITFEGVEYPARFLWSDREKALSSPNDDPRDVLAEWLASPENPNFAATAVNRVWQHLLGRDLVPEVDDLDLASKEERAEILDPLAAKFAEAKFDLRWLIAGICKSKVYRCASRKTGDVPTSPRHGVRPLKTLTPEQLFDSLEQALMLPVSRTAKDAARHNGLRAQIVSRFDETAGRSPEDYAAGIPQVLMLMNGRLIADATSLEKSRTLRAVVDAPFLDDSAKVETLYLATFTRRPIERERDLVLKHIRSQPDENQRRQAYSEVFWALLNSPEFALCR